MTLSAINLSNACFVFKFCLSFMFELVELLNETYVRYKNVTGIFPDDENVYGLDLNHTGVKSI